MFKIITTGRTLIGPRLVERKRAFSKLIHGREYTQDSNSKLMRQIKARILTSGPITVAQYMKEVLTNPAAGYYMGQDVFGQQGDFTTSPEISQMFGEMIAVWFYNEWQRVGRPRPLQLVELGPGRGTLMSDILRTFKKLNASPKITIHLVEISPHLTQMQKQKLCGSDASQENEVTLHGQNIYWHQTLNSVPRGFTYYLAHEFFDALPIHKLIKTEEGWREVLIDIDPADFNKLRFVLSRTRTPACAAYIDPVNEKRTEVEISPESWVIMQEIAARVDYDGGAALIVDYGHSGTKSDTFRAFRNHQLHDPLIEPGTADLTADVDFAALIRAARKPHLPRTYTQADELNADLRPAVTYGPVTQGDFLHRMGIGVRMEQLTANCSAEIASNLQSGYQMLTSPDQMGDKFKFLAVFPSVLESFLQRYPPAGFHYN